MAERFAEAGQKFSELVAVMARLRAPGGCPWDRKQTFETIKTYLSPAIPSTCWPCCRKKRAAT